MRQLKRPIHRPVCLGNCDYTIDRWSLGKPSSNGRKAIWKKLANMQNGFCCYCESIAVKGNGHIEHFFYKGKKADGNEPYKHMTFDWNNLFGSCGLNSRDTCGHYKDREGDKGPGVYDPTLLIKPDIDQPSNFFEYFPSGAIGVKSGLSAYDESRAKETLRVLNLQKLNGARKRRIDIFRKELDALLLLSNDVNVLKVEIDNIKQKIKNAEYQTSVLQVLF
jgi:uncharacterized protein (TIGR02646 family)